MEPTTNSQASEAQKPFYDRPYEEEEDGFIDERGFYTSPNGSFWDDEHNYFNHFGFDKHGGSYDKYGIYQPGPNFNPETGMYNDGDEEMKYDNNDKENNFDEKKLEKKRIEKMGMIQNKDEKTVKRFAKLVESDNESDDDENEGNKSNLSFDIKDFEEAYEFAMDVENSSGNKNMTSQHA